MQNVLLYILMSVMDAFFIGGTVWLIGWNKWSAWWMLLAFLLCAGTDPRKFLKPNKPERTI